MHFSIIPACPVFKLSLEFPGALDLKGQAYNNIGLCLIELEDFEAAISHFKTSLVIKKRLGNEPGQAKTWTNLGHCFSKWGKIKQSSFSYEQALKFSRKCHGNCHISVAICLFFIGLNCPDSQKKLDNLTAALDISVKLGQTGQNLAKRIKKELKV